MTLNTVNAVGTILALSTPQGNGQQTAPGWWNMFPLVLLLFAFYFAILRPQQRRQKQHDQLVKGLRAGDRVTTSGGIIGVVVTVKERSVSIRSADTKLEVLKSAISEIGEREGESSQQPQSQSTS
jgi:preprotein translocase subunit YajC